MPNLVINKSGGIAYLSGSILLNGNYTYVAGNLDALTNLSTLIFYPPDNSTITAVVGPSNNYYNVTFTGFKANISLSDTMNVSGELTLNDTSDSSTGSIIGGALNAYGNVTATSFGKKGSTVINILGSSDQTLSGIIDAWWPNLTINKSGGIAYLFGTIKLRENYNYVAGTLDAVTNLSTLIFYPLDNTTASVTAGSSNNYYNVTFTGFKAGVNLNGTMNILGTLNLSDTSSSSTGAIYGGTLNAYSDVSASSYGKHGTVGINMVGVSAGNLSQSTASANIPVNFTINKTVPVTLISNVSMTQTGQSLNILSGGLNMSGFGLTIDNTLSLNGTTLKKSGGVLTVGGATVGTGALYGGLVDP